MQYSTNENLDIPYWSREYSQDMRCRVDGTLTPESTHSMTSDIHANADFKQAHISGNQYREISKAQFSELTTSQRQLLVQEVYTAAQKGIGFWYGRYGLTESTNSPLKKIFSWLNSDATLGLVRQITSIPSLTSVSAQITSFAPGDFLTRHRDDVTTEKRRVAFVLNLTEQWHPDWGGLLQFFHDNGAPKDAWSPTYNSLCLFDVKHVHSVTCIAPFAPKRRLAISGWFHENN